MLKKNLLGIALVIIFFIGFYTAYSLGKRSSSSSFMEQNAGRQRPAGSQAQTSSNNTDGKSSQNPSTRLPNGKRPQNSELSGQPNRDDASLSAYAQAGKKQPGNVVSSDERTDKAGASIQPAVVQQVTALEEETTILAQTFYGTVAPFAEANVQSEQGGTIVLLNAKEGDAVEKGAIIVRFDNSDTQLELEQAVSSKKSYQQKVQEAESNFKTTQANADRYQKLFDDGFISTQQLDDIQNQLESARYSLNSAKENVTQAEAQIKLIKNTLNDFQIQAPISGFVNEKNYNLREVYKSSDVIYHLVNIDQVYIEIDIPEAYIGKIREQMPADVQFDALDGRMFPARIEAILPSGTADNRTFTVKALVKNADHAIKPGMFARVNIVLDSTLPKFSVSNGTVAYKHP